MSLIAAALHACASSWCVANFARMIFELGVLPSMQQPRGELISPKAITSARPSLFDKSPLPYPQSASPNTQPGEEPLNHI